MFFCQKLKILCSLDHPILFKCYQLMVETFIMDSNGHMEEFERKIKFKKNVLIGTFMFSLRMLTYRKSEVLFVFAPQTGKFEHYRMIQTA